MPPTPTPPAPVPSSFGLLLAVAILAMVASACGAADDPAGGDGATTTDRLQVADIRFDGQFQVTALTVDGEAVELISVPLVDIETEFGGLEVLPGCNTYFGSFTLTDDGAASFTITGGSSNSCDELGEQEQAVLAGLAAASRWEATDGGFQLVSENGDRVTLSR